MCDRRVTDDDVAVWRVASPIPVWGALPADEVLHGSAERTSLPAAA
jgi:hypothetical protein